MQTNKVRTAINLIIIFLMTVPVTLRAQQGFQWVTQAGGAGNDIVGKMVTLDDDIYLTGSFENRFNYSGEEISSNGSYDIYMLKTNKKGKTDWIRSLGGENADFGSCLTTSKEQIYMGGTIYGTVKMDKDIFENTGYVLVVTSWTSKGKLAWITSLPYTGRATMDVLQVLPDGSLLAGGTLQGTINTDAGELKTPNRKLAWHALLSASGSIEKLYLSSGTGSHRLVESSTDSENNLYLLYSTNGSIECGNDTILAIQKGYKSGLILQKWSESGKFLWGKVFQGTSYLESAGLSTSEQNDVVVGMNFNGKLLAEDSLIRCDTQLESTLIYLSKSGEKKWLKSVTGPVHTRVMDIHFNHADDIILGGLFRGSYSFGGQSYGTGDGSSNLFLLQINKEGHHVWSDAPAEDAPNACTTFALDNVGNIILTGGFSKKISIESTALEAKGQNDILLAKYFNCDQLDLEIAGNDPICIGGTRLLHASSGYETYRWNDSLSEERDLEVSQPGSYWVSAYTKLGCVAKDTVEVVQADSLDLGLKPRIRLYPGEITTLSANDGFISYSWNDGYLGQEREIEYREGETSTQYVLNVLTEIGCSCSDSTTVEYLSGKFQGVQSNSSLVIFPNPVSDWLWWNLKEDINGPLEIILTDSKSALLYHETLNVYFSGTTKSILVGGLIPGNLLLTIRSSGQVYTGKIIKQ